MQLGDVVSGKGHTSFCAKAIKALIESNANVAKENRAIVDFER